MTVKKSKLVGPAVDSFFLMVVRLVTIVLGLVVARLLSSALSLTEYGTYSEVMLIVSTVASVTMMGMMDGINYFYYNNENNREQYIATILSLQYLFSLVAGLLLLAISRPLVRGFGDENLRGLLIFAAVIPLLQNLAYILQVLFIAVGKARLIAARNLVLSIAKLALFAIGSVVLHSVSAILTFTVLMDLGQILYFRAVLQKNGCPISLRSTDWRLVRNILAYCVPMAAYLIVSTLSRDCDKYVISAFTNTDTLAIYTNASKMLPFDIVYASLCTVLVPYLSQFIADHKISEARNLYSVFMKVSVMTTSILAFAAITAAPMLLEFLYTAKYMAGLGVFVVYILVDIFKTFSITLILCAAGKSRELMWISVASLAGNFVLNLILFHLFGVIGPALATLLVTAAAGLAIQSRCARILQCRFREILPWREMAFFTVELLLAGGVFIYLSGLLFRTELHYFIRLLIIAGGFGAIMLVLCGRQLMACVRQIGSYRLKK